jgi:hypothetical protein
MTPYLHFYAGGAKRSPLDAPDQGVASPCEPRGALVKNAL